MMNLLLLYFFHKLLRLELHNFAFKFSSVCNYMMFGYIYTMIVLFFCLFYLIINYMYFIFYV
jgi:hypothetical protein